MTDIKGFYQVDNITVRRFNIQFNYVGYETGAGAEEVMDARHNGNYALSLLLGKEFNIGKKKKTEF